MSIRTFQVVARRKKRDLSPFQGFHHNLKDFTLKDDGVVSIDGFLKNVNVLPYWLDFKTKEVIFAQIKDVNQLSHAPFISDAIYESAERIFLVPFALFISLASRIESLKTDIVLAAFTPRSGSTLMCKIISRSESVFVMAEPICLNLIERHYSLSSSFGEDLYKSLILFFSDLAYKQGKKTLYIKPFILNDMNIIDRLFNITTKKIITWRSPFETMRSILEIRPRGLRRVMKHFSPIILKKIIAFQPLNRREQFNAYFNDKNFNSHQIELIFYWVLPMFNLVKYSLSSDNSNPLILHYDDLASYPPQKLVELILDYLELPSDSLDKMKLEFNHDSQAGTSLGRDRRNKLSLNEREEIKKDINKFLAKYTLDLELPRMKHLSK
jgi:hypothetical protein